MQQLMPRESGAVVPSLAQDRAQRGRIKIQGAVQDPGMHDHFQARVDPLLRRKDIGPVAQAGQHKNRDAGIGQHIVRVQPAIAVGARFKLFLSG